MKEERKQVYVSPAVESCRIALETGIAAVSLGRVSAQTEAWDEGESGPMTLGDGTTGGGDAYIYW
jgi:hypothetical protein